MDKERLTIAFIAAAFTIFVGVMGYDMGYSQSREKVLTELVPVIEAPTSPVKVRPEGYDAEAVAKRTEMLNKQLGIEEHTFKWSGLRLVHDD